MSSLSSLEMLPKSKMFRHAVSGDAASNMPMLVALTSVYTMPDLSLSILNPSTQRSSTV